MPLSCKYSYQSLRYDCLKTVILDTVFSQYQLKGFSSSEDIRTSSPFSSSQQLLFRGTGWCWSKMTSWLSAALVREIPNLAKTILILRVNLCFWHATHDSKHYYSLYLQIKITICRELDEALFLSCLCFYRRTHIKTLLCQLY